MIMWGNVVFLTKNPLQSDTYARKLRHFYVFSPYRGDVVVSKSFIFIIIILIYFLSPPYTVFFPHVAHQRYALTGRLNGRLPQE